MTFRRAWWLGFLLVFLMVPAQGAGAHATLTETDPSDGAVLDSAPDQVSVSFSEPVELPVGGVRIFDSSGDRIDLGDAGAGADDSQVRASLPDDAPSDVYVVTWRAVSLDGHPVRGAFMFQVGEGLAGADRSLVESMLGEEGETPWALAGAAARWVTYASALLAVGLAVFSRLVSRRPSSDRIVRAAAAVGVAGSLLQILMFGAESTGLGWEAWFSARVLSDAFTSPVGWAALLRTAGLAVLAGGLSRSGRWTTTFIGSAGVIGAELLTGHTRTTDPAWLAIGADAVHVAAAAFWLGGLVGLFRMLSNPRVGEDEKVTVLGRFSRAAVWTVAGLVAAGVALSWTQVRAPWALTSTAYGWTLIAKLGLVAAVVALAAYNNRVMVPSVKNRGGEGRARLARIVRLEAAGLVLVLAVTSLLVNLQPAAEAAGVSGPYSVYLPFGEGQLNLVVDPNRRGVNQVHAYVLSSTGAPQDAEGEATMAFTLQDGDVGPLVRTPQRAGPGHWVHTGPELAIAGVWEVDFRLGDGLDETSAATEVRVNP